MSAKAAKKKTGKKAGKKKTASKARPKAKAPAKKAVKKKPKAPAKKAAKAKAPAKKAAKKVVKKKTSAAKPAPKPKPMPKPKKKALTPDEAKARRAARAAQNKMMRLAQQRLIERRQNLIAAYNNAKGNTRAPNADGTEDYIDYAVSSYDRDFTLSLTEMERKQLLLVEEALKRIDRKEYGRCLNCAQAIPAKRLEVEPWARHCIRCQELEEQGLLEERAFEDRDDDDDEADATDVAPDDDDDDDVTL